MPFIIGAAIGGLVSGIGQLVAAKASKKQAAKNRAFQADMANTAYQRAMRDMKLAGLNPILAYKQGGAATPGGAMATIPDFGKTASAAIAGATAEAGISNTRESTTATELANEKTRLEMPKFKLENLATQAALEVAQGVDRKARASLKITPDYSAKGKGQKVTPGTSSRRPGGLEQYVPNWMKEAHREIMRMRPNPRKKFERNRR